MIERNHLSDFADHSFVICDVCKKKWPLYDYGPNWLDFEGSVQCIEHRPGLKSLRQSRKNFFNPLGEFSELF